MVTRLAAFGALLVGMLVPVAPAHAGTYTVSLCKTAAGNLAPPGWGVESRHGAFTSGNTCPGGYFWLDLHQGTPPDEYAQTRFTAPPDTEITGYRLWRSVQLSNPYRYEFYEVTKAGGVNLREACSADAGCTSLGSYQDAFAAGNLIAATGRTGVGALAFGLYCPNLFTSGARCPATAPAAHFQLHRADVTVSDEFPPVLALPPAGPLVSSRSALSGEQQVFVWATDRGGGVGRVLFEVDGKVAASATIDDNAGHCREPYTLPQPCKLEARGAVGLNTAALSDGRHRLRLLVTDATGTNATAWGPIMIRTANRSCDPRPHSDAARVQAAFSGRRGKLRVARYGRRLRVRGRVTRPDGAPMSGVSVCVAGRADFPGARLRVARSVTTDAKGRFKDTLRRGPSRRVFFVTRVPGGAASASLNVRVRAPVRLSARELVSGQALEFRGMVRGKPIPRRGVLVDLQVRKKGNLAGLQDHTGETAWPVSLRISLHDDDRPAAFPLPSAGSRPGRLPVRRRRLEADRRHRSRVAPAGRCRME